MSADWLPSVERLAAGIRLRCLEIAIRRDGAYLGQACSSAELLATLYGRVLRRDRGDVFVLSPAHYCLALWAALVELGELAANVFERYGEDGAELEMIGGGGAPEMPFTTGSLGQGLSQALGLALARRMRGERGRVFVLISDGELQEGQTWEAFMALAHLGLTSVTVLIDLNDSQVDGSPREVMAIEPVVDKLCAFGLDTMELDGHSPVAIAAALEGERRSPRVLACRTRIWQGIPSLAGRHNLHFVRFRAGEAEVALAELGSTR